MNNLRKRWYMLRDLIGIPSKKYNYKNNYGKDLVPTDIRYISNLKSKNKFYKSYTTQIGSLLNDLNDIYTLIFGEKTNGIFVEVGASNGENDSNTNFLADLGWKGIYIEPIPYLANLCKERHKDNNVIVENVAITNKKTGKIQLTLSALVENGDGGWSTTSEEAKKFYKKYYKEKISNNIIDIDQTTLNKILEKNNVQKNFDLLIIDTDGNEKEVLEGFSIENYMPKMVIIEINEYEKFYNFQREDKKFIINYFLKNGYRIFYKDLINIIFVNDFLGEK